MELNTHVVLSPLSSCIIPYRILYASRTQVSPPLPHTPIFQVGQSFVQTDF